MSEVAFRFLHAGDFHLEEPVHGPADVPDSLREIFIDAPYLAAQKVFDTAVAERVDFVLLSGDLLEPRDAGPRALAFLQEQFERLNSHGIATYWAGGSVDRPDAWPTAIKLPGGVQIFPRGRVEELTHLRADQPIATILGTSNSAWEALAESDFRCDGNLFCIAVAYGRMNLSATARQSVDYWALGGMHQHEALGETTKYGSFCGSPQGRDLTETGPHGCLMVHVNAERKVRTQLVPTDAVRFLVDHVETERDITRAELEKLLLDRAQALAAQHGDRRLVIDWRIHGAHRLANGPRARLVASDILSELRSRWDRGHGHVWPSGLEFEDATLPGEWYEEDSILGDFLRGLRDEIKEGSDLLRCLRGGEHEEHGRPTGIDAEEAWSVQWQRIVSDAGVLGAQFLRPEVEMTGPLVESRRTSGTAREMPT